jgi:pyridoxamine 5'-phosphate oxidase
MAGYKHLSEKSVDPDPFLQFEKWYGERTSQDVLYPNAFSLATASSEGDVSVRIVLLKDFTNAGFVFFTNYSSKKGNQLTENRKAAMLFFWPEKGRQIRIEGAVEKISAEESYDYFATRPRESRIGAWASEQSSAIPGKEFLDDRFNDFKEKFKGKNIPLPLNWGGFRLIPSWFEFWQEGKYRLHDRIIYSMSDTGWIIKRLAP